MSDCIEENFGLVVFVLTTVGVAQALQYRSTFKLQSLKKWIELQTTYTAKQIEIAGETTDIPRLYIGTNENISMQTGLAAIVASNQLDQPYTFGTVPPRWMIYDPDSWANRPNSATITLEHLNCAVTGTVSNREIEDAVWNLNLDLRHMYDALVWNGRQMKALQMVPGVERLILASTLCEASYYQYVGAPTSIREKFGRCASVLSSYAHEDAAIIGYKLCPPLCPPSQIAPWNQDNEPIDVEVSIFFRGSSTLVDWLVNFMLSLTDESSLSIKTHSGFLARHLRMWPVILGDVQRVVSLVEVTIGVPINRVRFAVGGHSQGGALATLTALDLSRAFPNSPIGLFTFSSPAIFGSDPLLDTCIRHVRVAVDNDVFPMNWFGRVHAGTRNITINGVAAGLGRKKAHSLTEYKAVLDSICNGDFTLIK